jgi:hypothetical protein
VPQPGVSYDHQTAVTLVGTAAGSGLLVPQEFGLICFNDVFPVSLLPRLRTAVSVPARGMCRLSAK